MPIDLEALFTHGKASKVNTLVKFRPEIDIQLPKINLQVNF